MTRLLVLVALCLPLAACSTSAPPSTGEPPARASAADTEPFASLLQTGMSYDFEPTSGPAAQASLADLVVVGTIRDIVAGRTLPYGRSNVQANLVIDVQKVLKGRISDKIVYAEVEQPAGVTLDDLRAAAPKARVVLFLGDRSAIEAVGGELGRPAGTPIYAPFVEGLILGSSEGWSSGLVGREEMATGWQSMQTIDDIIQAVQTGAG